MPLPTVSEQDKGKTKEGRWEGEEGSLSVIGCTYGSRYSLGNAPIANLYVQQAAKETKTNAT